MRDVLWQIWLNCGYFLTVAASGFFLYKLCAPFVRPRNGRFWRVLLFLTLAGSTGMVIWIGDPNLLYTLPAFFALFLLSTRGDRIGRVAVCIILFCLEMSVCALLDTYVELINRNALYDVLVRLARPLVFGPRGCCCAAACPGSRWCSPGGCGSWCWVWRPCPVRPDRRGAADLPAV
ncbi:MAG: hypothetical protein ACLSUM_06705 [Dysosmobacter welbionis]